MHLQKFDTLLLFGPRSKNYAVTWSLRTSWPTSLGSKPASQRKVPSYLPPGNAIIMFIGSALCSLWNPLEVKKQLTGWPKPLRTRVRCSSMRWNFECFYDRYSLVHLVVPKLEELISRTLLGLFKIRLLFQDRVRSQNLRLEWQCLTNQLLF